MSHPSSPPAFHPSGLCPLILFPSVRACYHVLWLLWFMSSAAAAKEQQQQQHNSCYFWYMSNKRNHELRNCNASCRWCICYLRDAFSRSSTLFLSVYLYTCHLNYVVSLWVFCTLRFLESCLCKAGNDHVQNYVNLTLLSIGWLN